jgi:hypothetical protein
MGIKQGDLFSVVHSSTLTLTPFPNGGWTIVLNPENDKPVLIGAYTTYAGMVTGLRDYLKNGSD